MIALVEIHYQNEAGVVCVASPNDDNGGVFSTTDSEYLLDGGFAELASVKEVAEVEGDVISEVEVIKKATPAKKAK